MRTPQFLQFLWGKIKERGNQGSPQADHSQNPAAAMPPYRHRAVEHHPTAHEKQHRATEQRYWQEQLRLAKELNVLTKWLNWITTIGAVGAAVGLFFLWRTLIATETAANATLIQAQVARETIRARITITHIEILTPFAPNTEVMVNVYYKNAGGSPALRLKTTTASWVCLSPPSVACPKEGPTKKEFLTESSASKETLETGEKIYSTIRIAPQTQENIEALREETKTAYISLSVQYRDIFSNIHTSIFCAHYFSSLNTLSSCSNGDSADQENNNK